MTPIPSFLIPLFDRKPSIPSSRSPFPTAAARSGGQGRPSGRRASRALPLTAASPVAGMARVGTVVAAAAMVMPLFVLPLVDIQAGESAPTVRNAAVVDVFDPLASLIAEASQQFDLPPSWLRAVIQVESGGVATALSPKGAIGMMQIMPSTYAELRARYGLGADPFDPHDNILAGAAYLREMFDRFGMPGFLAAYNAGSARYADHLATGRPLPDETSAYLTLLAPMLDGMAAERSVGVGQETAAGVTVSLFVAHVVAAPTADRLQTNGSTGGMATVIRESLFPRTEGLFVGPWFSGRRQ